MYSLLHFKEHYIISIWKNESWSYFPPTDTFEWLQPKMAGDVPAARGQHSMVVIGNQVALYGGSSGYDAESMMCHKFFGDTFVFSTGMSFKIWLKSNNCT